MTTPGTAASASDATRLSPLQWTICAIAAIGFAFDTYELLMAPLIVRPALEQLGGLKFGTPEYLGWVGTLFYLPAVCGGIFGLLGGYTNAAGAADSGKFTLTLRRGDEGRWLIVSDMDSPNRQR